MKRHPLPILSGAILAMTAIPAHADWTAANRDVTAAAQKPEIAAVLNAINALDKALVVDDVKAFGAALADDLAVNNPQNGVSVRGATASRNASGQISYSRYARSIEYAGMRGDMVLVMGEEYVVPKAGPQAGTDVRRRFTDLWKKVGDRWLLTARQATIIPAGAPQ